MTVTTRLIAAAMIGGLGLLGSTADLLAQTSTPRDDARLASLGSGSIEGIVRDERGAPVAGAMVSAIGASTAFALTDTVGRFELRTLSPGPYLVRAHLSGFAAPRGQVVEVQASTRAASAIALSRVPASYPVLEAGMGFSMTAAEPDAETAEAVAPVDAATPGATATSTTDDHSETAWRLRHGRRSVLKDAIVPVAVRADAAADAERDSIFGAPARMATRRSRGSSICSRPVRSIRRRNCSAPTVSRAASPMSGSPRRRQEAPSGPSGARSRRVTSRPGSSRARTRRASRRATSTTSGCRSAGSDTRRGIPARSAKSTARATPA
jgi:hypothetical protein